MVELLGMGAVGSLNRAIEFGGTRREYEQVQSPLLAGLLKLGGELAAANTRATAATAAQFLDTLQHRMPFPIRAVQDFSIANLHFNTLSSVYNHSEREQIRTLSNLELTSVRLMHV